MYWQRVGSVGVSMAKKTLVRVGGKTLVGKACGEACEVKREKGEKKIGRPRKVVSPEDQKDACEAAYLGMPEERIAILCGFTDGGGAGWGQYLVRNPEFAGRIRIARSKGELEMQRRILSGDGGWQGSAWLLERTRGYVARQQLEHSGPGGKSLTIAHQVLAVVNPAERA